MPNSTPALNPNPSRVALTFVVLGATLQVLLSAFGHAESSGNAVRFWELMLGCAWSWWVHVNRRGLKQGYAFEFDALVFFAWPIVVPYYLVKSRGLRGKLSAIPIWVLYALPFLVAITAFVVSNAQTEP
jgi:hypothetical protein